MKPAAARRLPGNPDTVMATPTWLPSGTGHVVAWVHEPVDASVNGAVVIAAPFGRESVAAYRSTQLLAAELVARGFVVVRFAWRGTADSGELTEDDVPAALAADLSAARRLAHSIVPDAVPHGIGLRVGASVLAASTEAWGERIVCDPIAGRAFVREQTALRKLSIPTPRLDGMVELVGLALRPDQATSLRALGAGDDAPVRVVRLPEQLAERLYRVEPAYAETPRAAMVELVQSFPAQAATRVAWSPVTERIADGVRERLVDVGEHRLPGVLVTPESDTVTSVAVFCAPGGEARDGPTGLSTLIARDIARQGVASLRVDRRGSGDLLDVSAQADANPYRRSDIEDIVAAAESLRARYPAAPLTGAGLCSGGWILAMAAKQTTFEALLLVNVIGWSTSFRFWAATYQRMMSRRAFMVRPRAESAQGVLQRARTLKQAAVRIAATVLRVLPDVAWKQLSRVGLRQDPRLLLNDVPASTHIELAFGPEDLPLWIDFHGPQAVRDLHRGGRQVEVDHVDALDHAALGQTGRAWIRTRFSELIDALPTRAA